jgi:hypothetical protein
VTGGPAARSGEPDPGWVERVADLWDGWAIDEDGVIRTLYLAGDLQPLNSASRRALATPVLTYLDPLLDVVAAARRAAGARPGFDSVRALLVLDEALAELDRYLGPPATEAEWPAPDYEQPPLL